MTAKQKVFLASYLNPANKQTYLNGTESALTAYDAKNRNNASSIASQTLASANVRKAMELIAEKLDIGVEVRLALLRDLAKGEVIRSTTRNYGRTDDGKMRLATKTIHESPAPPAARVQAIREIGEITGTRKIDDSISAETAAVESQTLFARIIGDSDTETIAVDRAIAVGSDAGEREVIPAVGEVDPGAHPGSPVDPREGGKGPDLSNLSAPSAMVDKNLVNEDEAAFAAAAIARFRGV